MKIELEKGFTKKLAGRIGTWSMEVGVLDDKPHFEPSTESSAFGPTGNLKSFAGGPARKQTRVKGALSTGEVLSANMARLNKNILLLPFMDHDTEMNKFVRAFLQLAIGRSSVKRVQNLMQAVVRNPILRQEYGKNLIQTAREKGFNRHLIDTAQMFKAIKAKVVRRV